MSTVTPNLVTLFDKLDITVYLQLDKSPLIRLLTEYVPWQARRVSKSTTPSAHLS